MSLQTDFICSAASSIYNAIISQKSDIETLDQAIGDGDHYINVPRGAETIANMQDELASLAPDEALNKIAMKLLSTVGGAAGPLFASLYMGMAKVIKHNGGNTTLDIAVAFAGGVQELIKRGKGKVGEKPCWMYWCLLHIRLFLAQLSTKAPRKFVLIFKPQQTKV